VATAPTPAHLTLRSLKEEHGPFKREASIPAQELSSDQLGVDLEGKKKDQGQRDEKSRKHRSLEAMHRG